MFDKNSKTQLDQAFHMAGEVTRSVLVLARAMGVKPVKMAEALLQADDNAAFNAEFTAELIKAYLAKTAKDEAEAKAKK